MEKQNPAEAKRSADEQAELEQQIRDLFEHKIVFNKSLGFRCATLSNQKVGVEFDMRPELVGHYVYGRLHGGVIASVLDVAGGLAVMWGIAQHHDTESVEQIMQRFRPLATIDMRVDYLRQGLGEKFLAEAKITRLGKKIGTTTATLVNDAGDMVATANAAYILI